MDCILLIHLYLNQVADFEVTNFKAKGMKAVHNFICAFFYFYVDFVLIPVNKRKVYEGGLVADLFKGKDLYLVELLAVSLFKTMNYGVLKKLPARDAVNLECLGVVFEDLLELAEFPYGE